MAISVMRATFQANQQGRITNSAGVSVWVAENSLVGEGNDVPAFMGSLSEADTGVTFPPYVSAKTFDIRDDGDKVWVDITVDFDPQHPVV